jgi:protein-tyrosine phosphatase
MTLAPAVATDRLVPLEAGFNLRDFGGYATADGRRVKRGMLFRSGTMALLTQADEERLRALGISGICDFRRQNERLAEPTRWHESAGIAYWSRDYGEVSGILGEMLKDPDATAEDMRNTMIRLYREIPVDHAPSYRAMFGQMAKGDLPILINCSAGKDRTGVGAALILAALGVPRETIDQDYLATNIHADWDMLFSRRDTAVARNARRNPAMMAPLLAADTLYLDALFTVLDADHGGVEGYLASIGVDGPTLAHIRAALVEP